MNGAHIDSPRLDLKPNPLFEKDEIAYLKPHYYGGIRKYQWGTVPLSMHGVVVKADGEVVEISIGENEGDPQFCVTDLLPHLASEQNILLRSLWPLLKNDGFLLYATCSVFPEEGTEQIRRFIADTPNAELVPLFSGNNGMLTLLPEESDTWKAGDVLPSVHDGFFYALLRKRA